MGEVEVTPGEDIGHINMGGLVVRGWIVDKSVTATSVHNRKWISKFYLHVHFLWDVCSILLCYTRSSNYIIEEDGSKGQ